ncbi:MAG: hypothetical protein NTX15_02945 [Candidatus Kapabacteria bacterium]|nr:hypothetical protein [Candidatus Kapabacteria bacterium]
MTRTNLVLTVCSLVLVVTGCELFVIGGGARRPIPIELSQSTSPGVVHLFKAELDSGNTTAATELMLSASGRPLLAVEKCDLVDDLLRWRKIMAQQPISETVVDTVNDSTHIVRITLDYVRVMQFSTLRRKQLWWVTKVQDAPKR